MLKLKILKATVFILTFLLIFGIIVLGMQLIKKKQNKTNIPYQISLEEPSGTQIKQIISNDDIFYILLQGGNTSDRIIIFDTQNNKKISTITIN